MQVYVERYFSGIGWLALNTDGDYGGSNPRHFETIREAWKMLSDRHSRINFVDAKGPLYFYLDSEGGLTTSW